MITPCAIVIWGDKMWEVREILAFPSSPDTHDFALGSSEGT